MATRPTAPVEPDDWQTVGASPGAAPAADDWQTVASGPSAPTQAPPQPEDRTAGNYARETIYGVGRGLKNDLVGAIATVQNPFGAANDLYEQTGTALKSARDAYTQTKGTGAAPRAAATALTFLENAPIVGGMVRKAEEGGTKPLSPESVGAAAEGITSFAAPEALAKGVAAVRNSNYVSKAIPKSIMTQLIRPMKGDTTFGKNPPQALLRENISGNSLRDIQDKVVAKLDEVGAKTDEVTSAPSIASKQLDMRSSFKPLDDAIAAAGKAGEQELYDKLKQTKDRLTNEWKPDSKGILRPVRPLNLAAMSPAEAVALKRKIGKSVTWSQDPLVGATNKALGQTFGVMSDAIDKEVPQLRELNERYANLLGAGKAIERRIPVAERNAHISLSDIGLAGTGHLHTAIARKILAHPAVASRLANALYKDGSSGSIHFAPQSGTEAQGGLISPNKMLPADTIGNAPYGEEPYQGSVPHRQAYAPPPPPETRYLPHSASPDGAVPPAPTWNAPPNAGGIRERLATPPRPAEEASKGFTVDEAGNVTRTPKAMLNAPQKTPKSTRTKRLEAVRRQQSYKVTGVDSQTGKKIGSIDGRTWFDFESGEPLD